MRECKLSESQMVANEAEGEVVRHRAQQRHALFQQSVIVSHGKRRLAVRLDIVPDEDEPAATLIASDEVGDVSQGPPNYADHRPR